METIMYPALAKIANEAQVSSATHPKCILQTRKLFDAHPFRVFWESFSSILIRLLKSNYKEGSVYVERAIDYISSFCTSMEKQNVGEDESLIETPLLTNTFTCLLKSQASANDNIRFYSCYVINKLLDNLVDAELSSDLWENIQDGMLERAQDSRVQIRLQALTVLYWLQDPENPECPVIKEYIARIHNDTNPKVRKLCVEKVALRRDVIPAILQHSLDVNEKVRLAAYGRALKFPQHFKIIERQRLIKYGMNGGSEAVNNFMCQHLIPNWLVHWKGEYLELLKALRLDGNFKDLEDTTEVVEFVLQSLFRIKPFTENFNVLQFGEKRLVPMKLLDWETILYWRILLQELKQLDEYEAAELMPEFIHFCDYIKAYNNTKKEKELDDYDFLQYQFTLQQMFLMVGVYDLSDTKCRQCLNQLISSIVQDSNLEPEVVQIIIDCLNYTLPDINKKIPYVVRLISDIMYEPPEHNFVDQDSFDLAQNKVKLHELLNDQEQAIKKRDFLSADSLNNKIEQLRSEIDVSRDRIDRVANEELKKKTDDATITKYMNVCVALLSCPKIGQLDNMLRSLKEDVVQDQMMHENETIRRTALKCYGLLCILDEQCAKIGIHVFCASIEAYKTGILLDVQLVLTAISVVVDLIVLFGSDLIANPHSNEEETEEGSFDEQHEAVFQGGSSLTTLIRLLVDFMQDENPEIQEKAGHGLCSLLLNGRIQSPSVVSRLIIKWASPATDEDGTSNLRQLIGMTLEQLPTCRDASDQIEKCVIPTLKTILRAPESSPLVDIDMNNLMKFLAALCTSCKDAERVLLNMANEICLEIQGHPMKRYNSTFSKMLLQVSLPPNTNRGKIRELQALCDEIIEDISERSVVNNIIKFSAVLSNTLVKNLTMVAEDEE